MTKPGTLGAGELALGGCRMGQEAVVFCNKDGRLAQNVVCQCIDGTTGEKIFFEIIGQTGMDGVPQAVLDGTMKYRRVLIQRVYPQKITR